MWSGQREGNHRLKAVIAGINAYFKSFETHLAASKPADLPQFQAAVGHVQDFIQADVLRDHDKDLRSLSLRIGVRMWVRTAWHLRKKQKAGNEDFRSAIRPYIEKILPNIQTSVSSIKSPMRARSCPVAQCLTGAGNYDHFRIV